MTDKERALKHMRELGIEVSEIGNTLQWTNPHWTCIAYYDAEGHYIKMETV